MTPPFTEIAPGDAFSAHAVVSAAFETGAAAVLMDRAALPDASTCAPASPATSRSA